MSEDMLREVAAAQRREFGDVRPRVLNRIMSRERFYQREVAGREVEHAVLGTFVISDNHKPKPISGTAGCPCSLRV